MKSRLSQDDIENLLIICGTTPTVWNSHGDMQVCCPVHGEVHPSCGVSSEKQLFHCFSCNAAGDFPWLLHSSQPDQFPTYWSALEFIQNEYSATFEIGDKTHDIIRYEELHDKKIIVQDKTIPMYKIAPYMSGKETYKYFFNRGFTKEDMKSFMIGRDLVNKTVTIPVFNENSELLGVIGRFINPKRRKNERYKIYDHFNRGNYLYPLDKFEVVDGTIIIVEGQFDAIRMYSLGYVNTLAKMGVALTKKQANWIMSHCDKVVEIGDNDNRGIKGIEKDRELLRGIDILTVEYPDYGKDICNWKEEDIHAMVTNAKSIKNRKIHRYI